MSMSKTLDLIVNTPVHQRTDDGMAVPPIICKDGARISVQASKMHYCTPRNNRGPWISVECGFPSVVPPASWEEYAEEWDRPTETVYAHVPIKLVQEFIDLHGGEQEPT